MERVSLEGFDTGNAGKFRDVQRPGAHAEKLRRESVTAVGADIPARFRFVPFETFDDRVKQRVVVETELFADALAMRENLRRMRVFLRRHVAGFFQHRHIDQRGRVALRAGIPVPVPGAAEIAALLDDTDIPNAGFRQPRRGGEPGKTTADEGEGDMVGLRRARGHRCVGIVEITGEMAGDLQILVIAVSAEPLVALFLIFPAQPLLVDRRGLQGLRLVRDRHSKASFEKFG